MSPHTPPLYRQKCSNHAFTLVELMVSVSILVILMLVVANFVNLVQRTWVRTNSNVSQFREARLAFDAISRNISQATLNTYWQAGTLELEKTSLGTRFEGTSYRRHSELQFVCGPTVGGNAALFSTGTAASFPGHGVFFQAPLGITSLVSTGGAQGGGNVADTQNMVNLLCGRGYFVAWGDDTHFRPSFLNSRGVPTRTRFRLMEFSPTAERNPIYSTAYKLKYSNDGTTVQNSKRWFQDAPDASGGTEAAINQTTKNQSEDASNREFTRPIAENILALIISPRLSKVGRNQLEMYRIAPNYAFDSTSLGAVANSEDFGQQGSQHLLPPLLHVTMIALDARGGELLSFDSRLQSQVVQMVTSRFNSAANYDADLQALENDLIQKRLAYRVFTSAIPLRQSRWSK